MKPLFIFLLLLPILSGSIIAQTVVKSRTADLQPGGYDISGKAILEELSTGELQLRLDDQFQTPAGPDVRIYLSDAQQSISNAIEIADIGTDNGGLNHFSGGITFVVPAGISIDQYDFIVFRCVDFNLHWAHGDFGATEEGDKANISGKITSPDGNPLSGFEVFINGSNSIRTNVEGIFEFKDLPIQASYTITPQENTGVSQGISTKDLLIMQKHILGIELFSSDFQSIAADISNNGSVSTGDMVQLQRLILSITTEFSNNQSWRFIPASDLEGNALDPSNFNQSFTIDNLTSALSGIDFIGVKIGDVSNATTNGLVDE